MLEVEIYSDNSPIWDLEFKQQPPLHLQAALELKGHQVKKAGEFEKVIVTLNEKDNHTTTNINPVAKKLHEKRFHSESGRPDAK